MSDRYFSPTPLTADRITLDGPEAHHLLHVMRAKAGARIVVFDGSGVECDAEITRCGRSEVEAQVLERREVDRELPFALVVGVSLPKGDRQKWLVEKLTELGATTLVPFVAARGVAQPTEGVLERLERSVIEAAKQCGRNRLMTIAKPQALLAWLNEGHARIAGDQRSPTPPQRLIAHPKGASIATLDLTTPCETHLAIGPEGGFTDDEVAAATAAGWQVVQLGPRILRVETAAVALAAAVALSSQ